MRSISYLRQWLNSKHFRAQSFRHAMEFLERRQMLTAAPTALSVNPTSNGIQLSWSSTVGSYDIYRGTYTTGESATPLATNVTTNTFLDPSADLVSGHDYYYTVTAVSANVPSAPSNEAFTFANGPLIEPTVDFSKGFPASSSSQFTSTGNTVFNSDSTISLGGTLQYDTEVNAEQFVISFDFVQPNAASSLDLSLKLVAPNGNQVTIFDGNAFGSLFNDYDPVVAGNLYRIQISYGISAIQQGSLLQFATDETHQQTSESGPAVNLPAELGSSTAVPVLTSNVTGQSAKLENFYYINSEKLPPATPTATAAPTGITLQIPSTYLGDNNEASSVGGPTEIEVYRGINPGQENPTPIATLPLQTNGETWTDTSAVPGITYYYVVDGGPTSYYIPPYGAMRTSDIAAASGEVSAAIPGSQQTVQLTGTPIGTPGSWDGTSTIYKVFDGNLNTYFDPANGNLTNWVGLDLGKTTSITQIKYAPRAGYEYRMLNGQFQVSTTPDFSSNVQTLYTITTTPTSGQLTTIAVNPGAGYRYIRYTGGLQWVNIAEMQVFGVQAPPPLATVPYYGNPIGTPGAWAAGSTITAAFDGILSTFFDPANGTLTNWVGLDLVAPVTITQISFAPRAGYEFRMVGGQFQVSSTPDFSSDVHTVYTITDAPLAGQLTTVTFPAAGAFRYVRYTGGTQWVNIAEMSVAGPVPPVPLDGTPIGTAASWLPSSSITAAFDGNLSTYFDPANGSLTNWVGLDLGSAKTITQISFAPRAGYEFRMVGGMFQVSSTPDFSANVQTIYTVTSAPVAGQTLTVSINPVMARYIRYTGGTQWVNIAEFEVDGM